MECVICGKQFNKNRERQKTCSKECGYDRVKYNCREASKVRYRNKVKKDMYQRDFNEIVSHKQYEEIRLYDRNTRYVCSTIIDSDCLHIVKGQRVGLCGGYAHIKLKQLHNLIMKKKKGFIVDHINRNKLDNRRCNLRYVTNKQNSWNVSISKRNTSGTTGVYYCKTQGKRIARITCSGKTILLGGYVDKQKAIEARKKGEKKYFKI